MKVVVLQADTAEGALHKSTASLGLKMKQCYFHGVTDFSQAAD